MRQCSLLAMLPWLRNGQHYMSVGVWAARVRLSQVWHGPLRPQGRWGGVGSGNTGCTVSQTLTLDSPPQANNKPTDSRFSGYTAFSLFRLLAVPHHLPSIIPAIYLDPLDRS